MKKILKRLPFVLVFLAGFSLLMYPLVANQWNSYRQGKLANTYSDSIANLEGQGKIDYEKEWQKAYAFNHNLLPSILPDSFSVAADKDGPADNYLKCLNLAGSGIMGTIEIPKIEVDLPIYHTTDPSVLQMAAGHLEGSSLPCGGESTHSVISAHRGLPSATLFTDLDKLGIGDHFLLHILDDILCYEVDQILVVEPDETEALMVENGKDLVTLLTCTPYGINSQRLLVRGHRIPYEPEVIQEEEKTVVHSIHTNYLMWVLIGLSITAFSIALMLIISSRMAGKKKEKQVKTENQESGLS